jgi:predicted RNase H-like HicB family nuclease
MRSDKYTAVIQEEEGGYVSLCPELDVASQGETVEEALATLKEAVELVLEVAAPEEIERRSNKRFFVTQFEAAHA